MSTTKQKIRRYTPGGIISLYHYLLSILGRFLFGNPSKNMVVIGVTGTSGKSTTVSILAHLLEKSGRPSGYASTVGFKIGNDFTLNDRKMTMLGRFQIQKLLRKMFHEGCQYAIIETTSEGILQYRHRSIHYDTLLFTNLWSEHIDAHGSFDNYKKTKLRLFSHLERSKPKVIDGEKYPRVIVANLDNEHGSDFLKFNVERKIGFGFEEHEVDGVEALVASAKQANPRGGSFILEGHRFVSPLLGEHNLENVLAAVAVGYSLGLTWEEMQEALKTLEPIPGRLEFIDEGQNFDVVIDYAFEPKAMASLYKTIVPCVKGRLIQVLGATGGGRDVSRRKALGEMAGKTADIVITTNEDPYDDDPYEIMEEVAAGVLSAGKVEDQNLFKVLDRRRAIRSALELAKEGDLVLITGKGSEQAMAVNGGRLLSWDDRRVAREEIKSISSNA